MLVVSTYVCSISIRIILCTVYIRSRYVICIICRYVSTCIYCILNDYLSTVYTRCILSYLLIIYYIYFENIATYR